MWLSIADITPLDASTMTGKMLENTSNFDKIGRKFLFGIMGVRANEGKG